jgi:hypothetical protein
MTDYIITPETLELNFQVVSPYAVIQNSSITAPLLKAIGSDGFEDCEYLITLHPSFYREERLSAELTPASARRYQLFLRAIDATLCEFRNLLRDLFILIQPFEAPYPILPFLSPIVGVNFNFDVPEELARREVANAIFLWQRKGTRDNLRDWVGFITGFRTTIREYYKEVIRSNVYNQSYAVTPSTFQNRGGANYGTLPHLSETHTSNTWAGTTIQLPFNVFDVGPNENYGVHGASQFPGEQFGFFHVARVAEGWDDFKPFPGTERRIESIRIGEKAPGFLFRNHIGVFIDIPDTAIDRTWFGEPFLNLVIDKLERIFDLICLFGVEKNLVIRLITDEDGGFCEQITFNNVPTFTEGWNDILPLPAPFIQTETVSCEGVLEDCIACYGETTALNIDNLTCFTPEDEPRLAKFVLCTNDPERITNDATLDSNGGPWLTWYYARYWTIQGGRYPTDFSNPNGPYSTFGVPGAKTTIGGDILQTYFPGITLNSEVELPLELYLAEQFIDPIIGTATGQGIESIESISQFVLDLCENGRFEDNILDFVEEWNDPFQDTEILDDNWNVPDIFADVEIFFDDWDVPATIDTPIHSDDWDITVTFVDNIEALEDWDITQTFVEDKIHVDNWDTSTPLTITGPGVWLDGDAGPCGNSPIFAWLDRFYDPGNLDAVQPLVPNRPFQDPNDPDFNDNGAVEFDGINDYMTIPDDPALNGDQFSIFAVFDWNNPGFKDTIVSKATDSTFTDGWGLVSTGSNTLRFYVDDFNTNFVDAVIPNNTKTIVCVRYNQARLELVVNGQLIASDLYGAGTVNSAKDLVVGAHNTISAFAGFFDGTLAEFIYYNRALNNSEKVAVIDYLSVKYNIAVDYDSALVVEDWDFAPAYSEAIEVTEPFDFVAVFIEDPEVFEPFDFGESYLDDIEVNEEWDEILLPTVPILEAFDDFDGDIPEVIEDWDVVFLYSETTEVTEPFDAGFAYSEDPEVTEPFDFGESYLDFIEVDEDWETEIDISDPGDLEYEEDWEFPLITDPGTFEYSEHWSSTDEVLEFFEDWEPTTFVVDSSSFQFTEDWDVLYIIDSSAFQFFETWEPTTFVPSFLFFENWNAEYIVDSSSFSFFENWNAEYDPVLEFSEDWDVTYIVDSSAFQFFEDWNT